MAGTTSYQSLENVLDNFFKCEELIFTASVASPQPDIINNLKGGEILTLEVQDDLAVYLLYQDKIVGSLRSKNKDKLVSCIKNGYEFEAKVKEINGGLCYIEVYAV